MKMPASDPVEERLRAEADSLRQVNGFSPLLHQRIMTALRQQGLSGMPVQPEKPRLWRYVGPIAVAAAVGLAAWITFQPATTDPGSKLVNNPPAKTPELITPRSPVVPPVPQVTFAASMAPSTSALEKRKYAYLDRDARKLFSFVANQLPSVPAQPQR
jgi:hypothetical protein